MATMQDSNAPSEELTPEETRFVLDLEFLMALANPVYLRHLATHENHYFQDERFIAYLKYLLYWKRPEYVKFVTYPHSLYILDLLQDENFRAQCSKPDFITLVLDQQNFHWKYYRSKRLNEEARRATATDTTEDSMQVDSAATQATNVPVTDSASTTSGVTSQ